MKLLVITSALDLRLPYGCTSAWWYLFKALYELDVDLLVTVYQGQTVPSPWWASYDNPCFWEGYTFAALKALRSRFSKQTRHGAKQPASSGGQNRLVLSLARGIIRPRWRKHVFDILQKSRGVDAVLFVNVPFNQLAGLPTAIRETFHIPVIGYDPDMPVSLPNYQGFATGFRIYEDTDLQEYDLIIGNSAGGVQALKQMGARDVQFLPWAVDPDVIKPVPVAEQDLDVFFYGYGDEYRQEWMNAMLVEPSKMWPDRSIAVRGSGFKLDMGKVRDVKNVPFSRLREMCCRSKINLNVGRSSHTSVYGSSSMRPYELAAMECCMVSNPYAGLEEWFEPGKEMHLLSEPGEVVELYPWLWKHERERIRMGKLARERVLKDHTFRHRARSLLDFVRGII